MNWDHEWYPRMNQSRSMYHSLLTDPSTLMKSIHLLARGLRSRMPDCRTKAHSWTRFAIPWPVIPLVRRLSNATRHDLWSTEQFSHHPWHWLLCRGPIVELFWLVQVAP